MVSCRRTQPTVILLAILASSSRCCRALAPLRCGVMQHSSSNAALFDGHCHLQMVGDPAVMEQQVQRARDAGVTRAVICATSQKDWAAVEDLAVKYPDFLIPSYGIHPWWLREHLEEEKRDAPAAAKEGGWQQRLVAQLEKNRRAGVGECGLDRTRRKEVSLDEQEEAMMQHLEVAAQLQRHATLHCVGAFGRLLGRR
eukprot:TRINITY_DN17029_c0_g1_i1.p1 TRINITY_DN17029_c0_g1~~TRINITY_DN17029_c0_g1_i1.p1  ORF type:complete len:198 (+),score=41.84 TRINITY_DN17029_c0_g1_i1:157-750(+)